MIGIGMPSSQSKRPRPIVISVVGLHTLVWVVSEAPQTCFAHCGSAVVWVIFDVLEVTAVSRLLPASAQNSLQ